MVYFQKNIEHKIQWYSWPNLTFGSGTDCTVQSRSPHIFQRSCLTFHKGFRKFYRDLWFLQPLKFNFRAKLTEQPVINDFFSVQLNFEENQYSKYNVKMFLADITILSRRYRTL